MKDRPFTLEGEGALLYRNINFVRVQVEASPCPVFVHSEVVDLLSQNTILLTRLGMYRYLGLK